MNIYLRGFILLLLLYATYKLYSFLNQSSETHLYYLSYIITFASVALIGTQVRKIIREFKHLRQESRFDKINTKTKWIASLSSPDELEYLMKRQKTADLLSHKVRIVKEAAYKKEKFQTLVGKYVEVLKEKIENLEGQQKDKMMKQLQEHQKELEISYLLNQQQFSYQQVLNQISLQKEQYLQRILQLDMSDDQKRQLIVSRFPSLVSFIPHFLSEYIESSAELRPSFFYPLMFTPFQQTHLNKKVEANPLQTQSQFYLAIVKVLITKLRNYSLALSLLQELLRVQQREPTPQQSQLLFCLRLISLELYQNRKISAQWEVMLQKDKYALFKEILDTMGTSAISTIKSAYDQLNPDLFLVYLTKYAFDSKLNTKQIIDFFNLNYIESNQENALSFVKYLKSRTVGECYHYEEIVAILEPFRTNKNIHEFLQLLKYCRIFYSFNLNTEIGLVQELWLSESQVLQEKALVVFREMVKSFSTNKMRSRYIDLDGQTFDLHIHESIIKLSLYLRKNFFKRLLTEQTMYQMIFQHLIHFERYGLLMSLLKEEILQKYMIDYSMIEIVVIEQIHTLFAESNSFSKIEAEVDRLFGLLTMQTSERMGIRALINVSKLLKKNRLNVDPSNLIKNISSSLLYTVANSKITIDREELQKLYRQISIFKNPQEEPNTNTKDYRKFMTWLAKKYYDVGMDTEGLEIIKQLSVYRPAELCNTIIKIIEAHPDTVQTLLYLGYDQVNTNEQFEFFRKRFAQNKPREKQITDYKFIEAEFISNQRIYSDLVAESKFIENSFKNPIFQTFFLLLGNNHRQSFFNAYKRKLPLGQIQFFLKESVKKDIAEVQKIVPWMYKTLIAKNASKVFGLETSYSEFTKDLAEGGDRARNASQQMYLKLEKSAEVDPIEKALLKKYHTMAEIRVHVTDEFLAKYFKQKDIGKFFQDKAYRKKEITELVSKVEEQDVVMLSKLAKLEQVNLLDLIIFHICGFLNSQKIPGNIEQYLINTTLLAGKTKEGADSLMEKFVGKVFCTRVLLSLVYGLMKLKDPFWKQYFKDKHALRILETLAAVEEESQFYGLLPHDLFSKQLKPSFAQQNLSVKKVNILNSCLRLQNVFVVSKALYLLNGFSSSIQKQVFRILCQKSPEASRKLQKLLE